MQTIHAVIFDVDGLMFDSERIFKKIYEKTNKLFSLPFNESFRQTICGKNEQAVRKELKLMFPFLNVDAYRSTFYELVQTEFSKRGAKCKKGLLTLMHYLQQNNIPMAIASGSGRTQVENLLQKAHINTDDFSCMICGDDHVQPKPHPEIFLKICEALHEKPEHVLVLEDSPNGIMGAYNAGCVAIMIPDIIEPSKEIQNMCYKILPDLYAVKKELLKLNHI